MAVVDPRDTLLIYAPVALHRWHDTLFLEDQACNGLRLWADNFPRLLVMMPVTEERPPPSWIPLASLGPALERIEIHPLPMAYRPDRFLRHLGATRHRIRALIARADYLGFAIGGLFGDWGAVACVEAHRLGRRYFLWADRVESEVTRRTAAHGPWRRRLRKRLTHRPMAWLERALIRRAALGLFHGRETYDAYEPFCANPEVVHDVHVKRHDHISAEALAAKAAGAAQGPLHIAYVGRADPMKGPLDWVEVLETVAAAGVDFRAVWLGDGDVRPEMQRRIACAGLADRVEIPGFAADRARVLATLRAAHLFLFCHQTPESPRCLIEALVSGCPIVGYDSAFPRDLVSTHQGGAFAPRGDVGALAAIVTRLAGDRAALADLIRRAAADGAPFEDVAVFRHRSALIKAHLGGRP